MLPKKKLKLKIVLFFSTTVKSSDGKRKSNSDECHARIELDQATFENEPKKFGRRDVERRTVQRILFVKPAECAIVHQ